MACWIGLLGNTIKMCGSIRYNSPEQEQKFMTIGYGNPYAALPVHRPHIANGIEWVQWGKRESQIEVQGLPITGWARMDTILKGGWDRYKPEFVNIVVQQFSEKGDNNKRFWFDIDEGYSLAGLIAHSETASRLFVITTPVPDELAYIHDRWPKIVSLYDSNDVGQLNHGYRVNIPLSRRQQLELAA